MGTPTLEGSVGRIDSCYTSTTTAPVVIELFCPSCLIGSNRSANTSYSSVFVFHNSQKYSPHSGQVKYEGSMNADRALVAG
ncbi:hypothetical protein I7I48_05974 [Histoplasma ohiense]|nr:hypothetical protein I7I48_05974 [Histoplasma ohiense (nom. inval.)]